MAQIKNSFDPETNAKIKKSFLFYGIPTSVATGITSYLKSGNVVESILIGIVGLLGSAINIGREYAKGDPQ